MICPAIAFPEVKTSQIARQVIPGAGVEMPDRGLGVVASRSCVPGALFIVVVMLKLGIELVPTVRRNMPPIVADLTLGTLAAAVVLTVTTIISAIVLVTTDRLAVIGSGVSLATIWAVVAAIARARLIGVRLARSTSRELWSARAAGVGEGAGM
jgi:hypothetical protein